MQMNELNRGQHVNHSTVEEDEQHGHGEPNRAEEVETSHQTSPSVDTMTSTSIDSSTLTSLDINTSASVDTQFCHRSTPLEIPERSSFPQDIADSTQKSTDVSSCYLASEVEKEITMEDFLELEKFLELEDGKQLGDLDSSEEVTMEDFLELEEWLEDMDQNLEQKLDDEQHTSGGDLETSPKADIDRHVPDDIDQYPPNIIDRHQPVEIDRHSPDDIDRHPWPDELPGYTVEMEPVKEIIHRSETSHLDVPKNQRPLICAEEAVGINKRVKRVHDPVKIVVPCTVFEAESPIPPDRSMQLSSYIGVFDDHQYVAASQRGFRFRSIVESPETPVSDDISEPKLINTSSFASIDTTTSPSIDTCRVSKQNEFEVC